MYIVSVQYLYGVGGTCIHDLSVWENELDVISKSYFGGIVASTAMAVTFHRVFPGCSSQQLSNSSSDIVRYVVARPC